MGVHHLWKILKPFGVTQSLADIVSQLSVPDERNMPCIGVDLSPCMDECIAATMSQSVNGQLPGGPLYIFFHKLIAFSKVRATFVFIFDGPSRPNVKRGKQVRPYTWWSHIVEELIQAFGFCAHHAPGEAEAELAYLNNQQIIDAVITSDNDAFVFGAQQSICHELVTNEHQHLPSRQPNIAMSIDTSHFPDAHILSLYASPLLSAIDHCPLESWYLIREPSLIRIRNFCQHQLHWNNEHIIRRKFTDVIFPALIMRILYSPITLYDSEHQRFLGPSLQVNVTRIVWKLRKGRWRLRYGNTRQPKLTFNTSALFALMGFTATQGQDSVTHVWVPIHALPNELRPHHQLEVAAQASRRQRKAKQIKKEIIDLTGTQSESDFLQLTSTRQEEVEVPLSPHRVSAGKKPVEIIDLTAFSD
ncbi:hypothetical protein CVT24_006500 [Panaeolus cyanescens]|uniref:XPG-I domain-containing protein n=1 Tax=Panaeolus cyanescens TaxID=181874 RepID=A0A409WIG8_9AGAR|nr:hypothetical protein CVT24_006500 [Panaeolus cyanescens]